MLPLLEPGALILADPRGDVAVGDVVVAQHPYRSDVILVKSIAEFDEAGRAILVGLNPDESTDSRTQGAVPREYVLGKVTSRF